MAEEMFNKEERKELKNIAFQSIQSYLKSKKIQIKQVGNNKYLKKFGIFVSLHTKDGNLRGCIGTFDATNSLIDNIKTMAVEAAFFDPRFYPLTEEEIDNIEIEISVLSPRKRIENIEEIEVGKHGIYITKGRNGGVLLPQVAAEYNWNRQEFLEHTCLKAGLDKDAWKEKDIIIEIFGAEVF